MRRALHARVTSIAELLAPLLAEDLAHRPLKALRHGVGLAILVECDGLANVVDDDLAGIAAGQVLLKFRADGGIDIAVDEIIQRLEQLFAFHDRYSLRGLIHLPQAGLQEFSPVFVFREHPVCFIAQCPSETLSKLEPRPQQPHFDVTGRNLEQLGSLLR